MMTKRKCNAERSRESREADPTVDCGRLGASASNGRGSAAIRIRGFRVSVAERGHSIGSRSIQAFVWKCGAGAYRTRGDWFTLTIAL